jgi:hypothetical protein
MFMKKNFIWTTACAIGLMTGSADWAQAFDDNGEFAANDIADENMNNNSRSRSHGGRQNSRSDYNNSDSNSDDSTSDGDSIDAAEAALKQEEQFKISKLKNIIDKLTNLAAQYSKEKTHITAKLTKVVAQLKLYTQRLNKANADALARANEEETLQKAQDAADKAAQAEEEKKAKALNAAAHRVDANEAKAENKVAATQAKSDKAATKAAAQEAKRQSALAKKAGH